MRICGSGKLLLEIGLGAAAGHFAMNIIRRYQERRRHAYQIEKQTDEAQKALSLIPNSHLAGIGALPVEIWGAIIEYVVLEHLGNSRRQCWDLANILRYRLVCKPFNNEVQHSLHQNIVFTQVPHLTFMRVITRWQPGEKQGATLYASLWASAISNAAKSSTRNGHRRGFTPIQRIVDRIRNCVIIAAHLQSESQARFDHSQPHPNVVRQRLCTAASTSTYCHEYLYMPESYAQYFGTYAEGDAYLEMALLVACGYRASDVAAIMVEFVKTGKLKPYLDGKAWGHTKSGRRWPSGTMKPDGPDRNWICNRCGKTFRGLEVNGVHRHSESYDEYY